MTGKQIVLGFATKPGKIIGPKEVLLDSETLLDVLGAKQYYSDYDNPDEPIIDGPLCCFCFLGNLQLNRVKTLLEGNRQINTYEYGCVRCAAVFQGIVCWPNKE